MSTDLDTESLQDIKGMTPKIMKLLIEEGFATPHQIAMAKAGDLTRIQGRWRLATLAATAGRGMA